MPLKVGRCIPRKLYSLRVCDTKEEKKEEKEKTFGGVITRCTKAVLTTCLKYFRFPSRRVDN
jgi:hypothetical protein